MGSRTLPKRQMEFVELKENSTFEESGFAFLESGRDGRVFGPGRNWDLVVVSGVAFTATGPPARAWVGLL